MKFYRLNSEQRNLWADKLMDLANFAVVGLIFSQVVSDVGPNTTAMGFWNVNLCCVGGIRNLSRRWFRMTGWDGAMLLLAGVTIIALLITGPTIWYDWKENREKRLKLDKAG